MAKSLKQSYMMIIAGNLWNNISRSTPSFKIGFVSDATANQKYLSGPMLMVLEKLMNSKGNSR